LGKSRLLVDERKLAALKRIAFDTNSFSDSSDESSSLIDRIVRDDRTDAKLDPKLSREARGRGSDRRVGGESGESGDRTSSRRNTVGGGDLHAKVSST
jgi:hypothetical protein